MKNSQLKNSQTNQVLGGDNPKTRLSEDEFGLSGMVSALALASSTQISADGYVIGIEGPWGSGKSSLAHFVTEQLQSQFSEQEIIFFDPWLVGGKSATLTFFLGLLAAKVEKIEDAIHAWWRLTCH